MDNSPSFWNLDFLKEMWEVVNDLLMRFYVYLTFLLDLEVEEEEVDDE